MPSADQPGSTGDGAVTRVVVADDSPDALLMLRLAIEGRDDVDLVAEAVNGEQAIAVAGALRPDLLVLDVEMPVLDGISALPRLREVAPNTRVVMLSNVAEPMIENRARAAGAVAYVHKSTPVTVLVDELLRAAALLESVLGTLSAGHKGAARDTLSPGHARRFLSETLDAWGESGVADTVALLVSELVANVVVHTSSAPEVSVRLLNDRVHVEVTDGDPNLPQPQVVGTDSVSGRGIAMVEALSLAWGAAAVDGGKVVWFDVARSSDPDLHVR